MTEIEDDTAAGVEPALHDQVDEPDEAEQPDPVDAPETRDARIYRLRGEQRPVHELLLWLDFETAPQGQPTASADTVLEAAWCVTYRQVPDGMRLRRSYSSAYPVTLDDWQLTPLRSRLCAIGPDGGEPVFPDECERWAGTGIHPRAAEMHEASGLVDEHVCAQLDHRVIEHPAVLERLILDDVQAAQQGAMARVRDALTPGEDVVEVERPRLFVAGSGVGHYDQPLLTRGQFPALARQWHYRPHDISHALHTLATVPHPVELILATSIARDYGRVLTDGLVVDPRIDIAGGVSRETLAAWCGAENVAHRAAADVVRAMMADLTARHLVGDALTRVY